MLKHLPTELTFVLDDDQGLIYLVSAVISVCISMEVLAQLAQIHPAESFLQSSVLYPSWSSASHSKAAATLEFRLSQSVGCLPLLVWIPTLTDKGTVPFPLCSEVREMGI